MCPSGSRLTIVGRAAVPATYGCTAITSNQRAEVRLGRVGLLEVRPVAADEPAEDDLARSGPRRLTAALAGLEQRDVLRGVRAARPEVERVRLVPDLVRVDRGP